MKDCNIRRVNTVMVKLANNRFTADEVFFTTLCSMMWPRARRYYHLMVKGLDDIHPPVTSTSETIDLISSTGSWYYQDQVFEYRSNNETALSSLWKEIGEVICLDGRVARDTYSEVIEELKDPNHSLCKCVEAFNPFPNEKTIFSPSVSENDGFFQNSNKHMDQMMDNAVNFCEAILVRRIIEVGNKKRIY